MGGGSARAPPAVRSDRLWTSSADVVFAVISDIHSNLEAMEAVLADIGRRGVREMYCLGDIVGYGASPGE